MTIEREGRDQGHMKITMQEAVMAYTEELKALGRSDQYVKLCQTYLRKFQRACQEQSRGHVSQNAVTAYFSGIAGQSQASRNNAISTLRGFLEYLEDRREIRGGTANLWLKKYKTKPKGRKPKHYIPASDFEWMLELSGKRHAADRAAMAMALYTLARQSEIVTVQLKDVDLDAGIIRMYRHKMARWTEVPVCPELEDELLSWLTHYSNETGYGPAVWKTGVSGVSLLCQDHPDWYLIPSLVPQRNAGPFDATLTRYTLDPSKPTRRLERLVQRVLTDMAVKGTEKGAFSDHLQEGMHTIRRSGARAMLDHLSTIHGNDKALLQVSIMLDHDEPRTTLLYIGREIERDRLHEYLRSHSMYGSGDGHTVKNPSNVIPIKRERDTVDAWPAGSVST